VRIVDDITGEPGQEKLGRLAEYVRDRRTTTPDSQRHRSTKRGQVKGN